MRKGPLGEFVKRGNATSQEKKKRSGRGKKEGYKTRNLRPPSQEGLFSKNLIAGLDRD